MAIEVFRALTGQDDFTEEIGFFNKGVSVRDLRENGITCSNGSLAQQLWDEGIPTRISVYRAVPGLPVFVHRPSAENWLAFKRYMTQRQSPAGLAVVACMRIPEEYIADGKVKIVRNGLDQFGRNDRVLTLAELQAHQSGEALITQECYIPELPKEHRDLTTFMVVTCLNGVRRAGADNKTLHVGSIDFGVERPFIDLAELGWEF